MRDHAERLQSLGRQVQEDIQKSLRELLLQVRASCQLVRTMAMRIHSAGTKAGRRTETDPREVRGRRTESLGSILQKEKRGSKAARNQKGEGSEKSKAEPGREILISLINTYFVKTQLLPGSQYGVWCNGSTDHLHPDQSRVRFPGTPPSGRWAHN